MKIYSISGSVSDSMGVKQHWHYEPTMAAAKAYVRDYKKDDPHADLIISQSIIGAGRDGITEAMNDFIEWTCLNE